MKTGKWALGRRLPLAFGIGLLLAACFPPFNLRMVLPLALACLLLLLDGMTVRQATYLGLTCGFALFASGLSWLQGMFGAAAVSLWVICAAFPACFCALTVLLRSRLLLRLPRVPEWLLVAVTWTAIEYFRSELFPLNFAWMGLGYALVDVPALVAPAAWIGCYGLTFLLVAFGAVLANLLRPDAAGKRHWKPAAACYLVWLLLPLIPITPPVAGAHSLAVRLVQANSEDDEDLFGLSAGLSQGLNGQGNEVLVWPEYSFISDPRRDRKLWERLTRLAQEEQTWFLFGAKDVLDPQDDKAFRNTAFLLDPAGHLVGQHVKNHTVHFINDGIAGTQARAFDMPPHGRVGVAICFDLDYPDVARRLVDDGAECLLAPSDNPLEWGRLQHIQHRQMFQMRAVECGRWVATADVAGNTFTVAPSGQIVQSVTTTDAAKLDVIIGMQQGRTLFVSCGWRSGQLCLLMLLTTCLAAMIPVKAVDIQQ